MTIQFKKLNAKRGPAVRGTRVQCDKDLYSQEMYKFLKTHENLETLEADVASLVLEKDRVCGVVLANGSKVLSQTVIITTGNLYERGYAYW